MHLQPEARLSERRMVIELALGPCWLGQAVEETEMEEAGGTEVVGVELGDIARWLCFEAYDAMVL